MTLPLDLFFINLFNLTLGLIPVIVVAVILAKLAEKLASKYKEGKMKDQKKQPTKMVTNEDECFNCGCNLYKNCSGYKPEDEKKEKK